MILVLFLTGGSGWGIWYGLQELEKEITPVSEAIQAVPSSAALIYETYDFHALWNKLTETNVIWAELQALEYFRNMYSAGAFLDSLLLHNETLKQVLHRKSVVVSAHMSGASRFDFLYCTSIPGKYDKRTIDQLMAQASKGKAQLKHRIYDKTIITQVVADQTGFKFSYAVRNGLFVASVSSALVEDAIRNLNKNISLKQNSDFLQVQKTAGVENTDGNLYINYGFFPVLLATYLNKETTGEALPLHAFASWSALDLFLEPNALSLEGFTYSNDTINNYLNIFLKQKPVEIKMATVMPGNTAVGILFGLSNPKDFLADYRIYLEKSNQLFDRKNVIQALNHTLELDVEEHLLSWLGNEIALVKTEPVRNNPQDGTYIMMSTTAPDEAISKLTTLMDTLASKGKGTPDTEVFEGHQLHQLHLDKIWEKLLGTLFRGIDRPYFSVVNGYVVFANSKNALRSLIRQHLNSKTLVYDHHYTAFAEQMASSSNIVLYTNIARSPYLYKNYLTEAAAIDTHVPLFRKFDAAALQFANYRNNLFLNNIYLKYNPIYQPITASLWETTLDTTCHQKPFLVQNHRTKTWEVFVQDDKNTVYLISTTGNILWKKNLKERIIGEVQQIDALRNNKLQLLFSTRSNLYLLDRKGNHVSGFPVVLPAPATHHVQVMDYDRQRNYRLLIPAANHKVYNYDQKGNKVEGWSFAGSSSKIENDFDHLVVDGKDYIFMVEKNGKVYLADRRGKERVNTTVKLGERSHNPVFIDRGNKIENHKVVYTHRTGKAIKAWFNGHTDTLRFKDYSPDHHFLYKDLNQDGAGDYIFLDGRTLDVYAHNGNLIFTYTFDEPAHAAPALLKLGKHHQGLAVWGGAEDQVWVFDQQGSPLEAMPLYGSSVPRAKDMNLDGTVNLVTTHKDGTVYAYSLK